MSLTLHDTLRSPPLLVTTFVALLGWLLKFIGVCMISEARLLWWIVILDLVLLFSIFFTLYLNVFDQYKLSFLVFLSINSTLSVSILDASISIQMAKLQVLSAGTIMLIISEFFWILVFTSSNNSALYKLVLPDNKPSHVVLGQGNGSHVYSNHSKVALSSLEANEQHQGSTNAGFEREPSVNSVSNINHTSASVNHNTSQEPPVVKVTALHPYNANPDDPNELSFAKDEVLDILNKNGNWWQARKQDGSIGIVPSNYFNA